MAVADERVLTAGEATAQLAAVAAGPGAGAFVIGAPAFWETVAEAGLTVLEGEAGARPTWRRLRPSWLRLRGAAYARAGARGGAALLATSRDPTLPMPGGAWPGTGAILAAVETATGDG